MNTIAIVESLARDFKGVLDWKDGHDKAFFEVRGSIPVVIKIGHLVDGVQWFHMDVFIGEVVDQKSVPLHRLLYANAGRESMFAIRDIQETPWIVVRDRYALRDDMPAEEATRTLAVRLTGAIGMFSWDIPGVKFCEGLS